MDRRTDNAGAHAGKRFRTSQSSAAAKAPTHRPAAPAVRPSAYGSHARRAGATTPRRSASRRRGPKPAAVIATLVVLAALIGLVGFVVVPGVGKLMSGTAGESVPAGQDVTVQIPEGASGDAIAQILVDAHVVESGKEYYAAVLALNAEQSLQPGDYALKTGMDPQDVVRQLMAGPNIDGSRLVVQEGLTVAQVAAKVEEVYGIPADDFVAQAKASTYVSDYPFLEGAYDDSLEGYLYPKTYALTDPTADQVIRAMLDQFQKETADLALASGANGLTEAQIVSMASLIERETAVEDERPTVASVIYNRLSDGMPLQIDAAIVYARGGGTQGVSYSDLEIDSPYNVYKNTGLTPGPICSPSVSSIKAALRPASTDYLYYVASSKLDGSHVFTASDTEFERYKTEYYDALENQS